MVRLDWRSLLRLALAHHPGCHPFRGDVFRVGPFRLCVGCWTTYPVAILVFVILFHLGPGTWALWLTAGLALCSVQLWSSAGWTTTRTRRIGVKAVLGLGVGAALHGILVAPFPAWLRIAALAVCALAAALTVVPRGRRLVRTCEGCFFKGDWERCPGMALVRAPDAPRGDPNPPVAPQRL